MASIYNTYPELPPDLHPDANGQDTKVYLRNLIAYFAGEPPETVADLSQSQFVGHARALYALQEADMRRYFKNWGNSIYDHIQYRSAYGMTSKIWFYLVPFAILLFFLAIAAAILEHSYISAGAALIGVIAIVLSVVGAFLSIRIQSVLPWLLPIKRLGGWRRVETEQTS